MNNTPQPDLDMATEFKKVKTAFDAKMKRLGITDTSIFSNPIFQAQLNDLLRTAGLPSLYHKINGSFCYFMGKLSDDKFVEFFKRNPGETRDLDRCAVVFQASQELSRRHPDMAENHEHLQKELMIYAKVSTDLRRQWKENGDEPPTAITLNR